MYRRCAALLGVAVEQRGVGAMLRSAPLGTSLARSELSCKGRVVCDVGVGVRRAQAMSTGAIGVISNCSPFMDSARSIGADSWCRRLATSPETTTASAVATDLTMRCSRCDETKDSAQFSVSVLKRGWGWCKLCWSEYNRARYNTSPAAPGSTKPCKNCGETKDSTLYAVFGVGVQTRPVQIVPRRVRQRTSELKGGILEQLAPTAPNHATPKGGRWKNPQ